MARPLEHVEPLPAGTILRFKRFSAEVLHLPGHTPGLICLWAPEARVLFSADHLLERVSPNPLLDLEGQVEPTHKALVAYVESARRGPPPPAPPGAAGPGEALPGPQQVIRP